jgi:hypothetical protein
MGVFTFLVGLTYSNYRNVKPVFGTASAGSIGGFG